MKITNGDSRCKRDAFRVVRLRRDQICSHEECTEDIRPQARTGFVQCSLALMKSLNSTTQHNTQTHERVSEHTSVSHKYAHARARTHARTHACTPPAYTHTHSSYVNKWCVCMQASLLFASAKAFPRLPAQHRSVLRSVHTVYMIHVQEGI